MFASFLVLNRLRYHEITYFHISRNLIVIYFHSFYVKPARTVLKPVMTSGEFQLTLLVLCKFLKMGQGIQEWIK